MSCMRAVELIDVVFEKLANGVERLVSAAVKLGVPTLPAGAVALDLDDAVVRDFLFVGAAREGFDIPVDAALAGGVWLADQLVHIRVWLA